MDNLMYDISAPGSIALFGSESLSVWLPTLVASIDRRLTVTLKELQDQKNFELHLPDLNYEFKHNNNRITYKFLEERLPMNSNDIRIFNWKTPQLINMPEMDNKITNFLVADDKKRTPQQTLALKVCIFLYSGIFSSCVIRVKPMSITITSKIKMNYRMGSFKAYCVAMAAAFIQYLKFKTMIRQSKDFLKKLFRTSKADLTNFTDEEKEAIMMWACCATYFRPNHTSGSGVYCSIYGCLCIYTSKEVSWKNEVEHLSTSYQPSILLVDTGVDCRADVQDVKKVHKEVNQGLYHAWCLLTSRISITAARLIREIDSNMNSKQSQEDTTTAVTEKSKRISKLCFLIQVLLRSLHFSHRKADEILEIAYKHDLRGCIIGSACGGMVFIFIPPLLVDENKLKEAYKKANFRCISTILGAPGISVKAHDGRTNRTTKD